VRPSPAACVPEPGEIDSLIAPGFAALFAQFACQAFRLLSRGSRDGFTARAFRARCDGRAKTVALIEDTHVNIVGAFAPIPGRRSMTRLAPSPTAPGQAPVHGCKPPRFSAGVVSLGFRAATALGPVFGIPLCLR
jgi:hypothetical protein